MAAADIQRDIAKRSDVTLLSQFRERRVDPRECRDLSELGKDALCLCKMLNCKRALFLGLVKQAENHLRATCPKPFRVILRILKETRRRGTNA